MKIRKIFIKNLFGLFDHEIKFNTDERITIIHGPNGVGKTTVLKLIDDIFKKRFFSLRNIPYTSISINFDNKDLLKITRKEIPDNIKESNIELIFSLKSKQKEHKHTLKPSMVKGMDIRRHLRIPMGAIDDLIPNLERVDTQEWFDRKTDETIGLEEVVLRYGDKLPGELGNIFEFPKWLVDITAAVNIHFIQTQRLFAEPEIGKHKYRHDNVRLRTTVEKYSVEMAGKIQEKLKESGSLAASFDRTFPNRLLGSKLPKKATEEVIRERYEKQIEYRKRLMTAGLIDEEETLALPTDELGPNDRKVLWHYLNDVDSKLKVFDELLDETELFINIINTRFLYKKMSLDKTKGFVFTASKKGIVPLRSLSSGEQHELVLAYELLFMVKERSLILIDEPELSLHVTWQRKFLEDIKRISDLANLDFLIATHSPLIINTRDDLMVALEGSHQ